MCPEISVDLSEAVEFTPIVPGKYTARVVGAEPKTSQKGGVYIKWELQIYGAEGELARFNNHKVWHNTMTSGPGAGMLKTLYKAATGTDLAGSLNTDVVLGKELLVTLAQGKDKEGQPSQYPEVKAVEPAAPF